MSHLMSAYGPPMLSVSHGEGCWLWDEQGTQYLDAFGGIAVCALGHSHPILSRVIAEQAGRLMHCSNLMRIPQQEQLGGKLCRVSGMQKLFLCNSGAEANEAAIKLSRLYARRKKVTNPLVVTFENSFHGRTMATLSATGNPAISDGFEPILPGFVHLPYNDVEALANFLAANSNVVAVMLEPIQGEAGIVIPEEDYLAQVRELCNQHDCLMIVDEIQSGMGRTGEWFAFQHSDVQPDVVTVAKSLGNGFPIGACLATGEAAELFTPGTHGSTFGGNPLASTVANEVIQIIETEQLVRRAAQLGDQIVQRISTRLASQAGIVDVRGKGLMIGIQFKDNPADAFQQFFAHGILVAKAAQNCIRLLPAYNLTDQEVEQLIERVCSAIEAYFSEDCT